MPIRINSYLRTWVKLFLIQFIIYQNNKMLLHNNDKDQREDKNRKERRK